MFGEEEICLKKQIQLDERRITIPSITRVEKEEPIGFIYNKQQNCLLLYNHFEYEAILKKVLSALEKMKKSNNYDPKFLRALERNFFAKYCFKEENTTNHLQLLLPEKAVQNLEFQTSVYAVGVNTHLALFQSEETYKNIVRIISEEEQDYIYAMLPFDIRRRVKKENISLIPETLAINKVYKIREKGFLEKDGFEEGFLYLPVGSGIKRHIHFKETETYILLFGDLVVRGKRVTENHCNENEWHEIKPVRESTLIKTYKKSLEKESIKNILIK